MEEKTQQPERAKTGRTIWLLGVLVLMVCGWGTLIVQVPMLLQRAFPGFLMDRDSGTATLTLTNQNVRYPWSQEINFDVRSGTLDWKMSREVDELFFCTGTDANKNGFRIRHLDGMLTGGRYLLASPPGSGVADREFRFPQFPYQVNERFAVSADADELLVMDFADESSTIKTTKVGGVAIMGGLRTLEGVDGILRFQNLPAFGNPPSYQVQHFAIGADLAATPGFVWQAIDLGTFPYQCVASPGDQIVSINPTNFEVEFRDASNGKLIESMPLLEGMDPVTMPCNFWGDFLRIQPNAGLPRFLDLKRRVWLPPIEGDSFGPFQELDDRFILFSGGRSRGWGMRSKVFDIDQQAVISEFDSNVRTDFIDEDSVVDMSFFSGLTFQKIDLQSGQVIQTWKPFWWVILMTSFLCVGWLVWSWRWLSSYRPSGNVTIWIDVAIVALVPLVLCVVRIRYIGDLADLSRVPTQVAQSIILALLLCGVVWVVHTRVRIVPRLLPFLMATVVLAASVSITFNGQLRYVAPEAIKAMVPASVFFACFFVLKGFGFRLLQPGDIDSSRHIEKASSVTIRDMFVLVAVLSCLFAGLSPWLPSFADFSRSLMQVLAALFFFMVLSLAPVFGWCLAMAGERVRTLGNLIFLATFGFLLVSTAYRFTGDTSVIYTWFGVIPVLDVLPAMCFVATYWIASCFKLRGWKFSRMEVANASEV